MSALDGLHAFVAVCDGGSITAGAAELGMPRATVGRQIARLEEDLGVRLLHRSTRSMTKTAAGLELYSRARRVVADALAAREAVAAMDDVPRGLLRLSVPAGMLDTLGSVLLGFLERYPAIELEVVGASRFVDLVAEGFDAAVRGGALTTGDLVARRLHTFVHRAYASPAYLEARGVPERPEDLVGHDCIRTFTRGTVPQTHWPLQRGGQVPVSGRLATDTLSLVDRAVRMGQGIAMLPFAPAGAVPVLSDVLGFTGHLSVVYPERALLPAKVRVLVDHLVEHADALLPEDVRV
jgi:DNA-binding transcriptional LysR family regulator